MPVTIDFSTGLWVDTNGDDVPDAPASMVFLSEFAYTARYYVDPDTFFDTAGTIPGGADIYILTSGDDQASIAFDYLAAVTIYAGQGADTVFGGGGNDFIYGESGNDLELRGGEGNDVINGGTGNYILDIGAMRPI